MQVSFRFLNQDDIFSLRPGYDEILGAVEEALKEHAAGAFEMPPKPGIHPVSGAFIHAMPAYLSRLKAAGIKWVSGFPENTNRGLPMILGVLILNDPETGFPLCLMDATWITTIRTAAVSALAAKHLLRRDAGVLGIVGAGLQGTCHTEILLHLFSGFDEIHVYDIEAQQLEKFREKVQKVGQLRVVFAPSPRDVFEASDMVVTATGRQQGPVVERSWLKPGGLYIGLESFRYWREDALLSADKFITDDWKQARSFIDLAGHIHTPPALHGELGQILAGFKPGRQREDEIIACIFVGMALVDVALGSRLYRVAERKNIGTVLDLGRYS